MQFQYTEVNDMPPLAWVANIKEENISVMHGCAVDCHDHYFVEGAWSGELKNADFLSADWFCGTGACIQERGIVFSTPSPGT